MAVTDSVVALGEHANDFRCLAAKSKLVEQDHATWTWENLSREFPNNDDIKHLAGLQRFVGV